MFPEEVCLGCGDNNEFIILMVLEYSRVYSFFPIKSLKIQGKQINAWVYLNRPAIQCAPGKEPSIFSSLIKLLAVFSYCGIAESCLMALEIS